MFFLSFKIILLILFSCILSQCNGQTQNNLQNDNQTKAVGGNFENSDSAKVTITNKKGKVISTNKFMTAVELRTWARENFTDIFASIIGDNPKITSENIKELRDFSSKHQFCRLKKTRSPVKHYKFNKY